MSRSHKRPYYTDGPNPIAKGQASRAVRHYKGPIPNGKAYRK